MECCICGRPIRPDQPKRYLTGGLYRHQSCEPGSEKWKRSRIGRESKYARYFQKESS
jgi:hypothetical protein